MTGLFKTHSETTAAGIMSTQVDADLMILILSLLLMLAALAVVTLIPLKTIMAARTVKASTASVIAATGMMTGHPVVETTTLNLGLHGTYAALVEEAQLELARFMMKTPATNGKPPVIQLVTAVVGTWPIQETVVAPGMMKTSPPLTAVLVVVVNGTMTKIMSGKMTSMAMMLAIAKNRNTLKIPLVTAADGTLME